MTRPVRLIGSLLILLSTAGCMVGTPKGEVLVYVAVPLSGWQADCYLCVAP